jgi:hypothetical protein
MTYPPRASKLQLVLVALVCLLFLAAPTPGDIGGCGQPAQLLDAKTFFGAKRYIDCKRCDECSITFSSCTTACDLSTTTTAAFPQDCYPLVHDGEVCLRALQNASCSDYSNYMNDFAPEVPSECNFCPQR